MRTRSSTRAELSRQGFTLVDLLVVIAIVGVMISLLMPAVQAAREAARRASCLSNVKQLSLAVLGYNDAHKRLPASGQVGKLTTATVIFFNINNYWEARSGNMFSWITQILPYAEEVALYERFNFKISVLLQPNEPQEAHVAPLLCPSDSAAERIFVSPSLTNGKKFGKGNYAAWGSPYHLEFQDTWPGALGSKPQPLFKISDGLSKTLLLSEVRTRDYLLDQRGAWALPWIGASLLAFDAHHDAINVSSTGFVKNRFHTSPASIQGPQLPNGDFPDTLYDCSDAAKAQIEYMPCEEMIGSNGTFYTAAPRSLHLGGVNVAFVDGHAEFLSDSIDKMTMAYLISINDGQRINWK